MRTVAQASTQSRGKAIVVLSDGTGNSAAQLAKTNVWRLYQALDLSAPAPGAMPRQVAYYDDGVGSSSFRPLAILGGVFGWGLKRNILDLYTFLCRNYEEGDRIYAFGFSRGAFTIRTLIGLVVNQGLLKGASEDALARYAPDAYRAYRRRFQTKRTPMLVDALRGLRDRALRALRSPYAGERVAPDRIDIAFVGVWDTVAAYGMPIAELTRGIDHWVFPLSMPNYVLSPMVKKACHALSLDDERDTFHPLLWDEFAERRLLRDGDVAAGRLQQVWFTGMHSDIGGGYADDTLAHVSLAWMMGQAQAAGLRFACAAAVGIRRAADQFGPMHDSRRGMAGYYRYQPRKIGARLTHRDPRALIMQDPEVDHGLLTSVKIHESVFDRIASAPDRYAPIVLPRRYVIVGRDGVVAGPRENAAAARLRAARQEWLWNDVWRRRVNYFATVFVSLWLALLPWLPGPSAASACHGPQCLLSPVILGVGRVLPGFVQPWVEAFAFNPLVFAALVPVMVGLLLWSGSLQRRIHDGMRDLWEQSLNAAAGPARTPAGRAQGLPEDKVYRLRTSMGYQRTLQFLKWQLVPGIFGLLLLAIAVLVALVAPLTLFHRLTMAGAEWSNRACEGPEADRAGTVRVANAGGRQWLTAPGLFSTDSLCWHSGLRVEEGGRYRIVFEVREPWADASIPASPAGFQSGEMPWMLGYGAVLLRRSLGHSWFQPLLRIAPPPGAGSSRTQALVMRPADARGEQYAAEFEATRTGEVYLYVNDAIPPWGARATAFYENNQGTAEVSLARIDGAPPVGP